MAAIKMKTANLFRGQKYREEYTRTWPFIKKSSLGEHYVKCELCRTDVAIKHSGKYDISTHISSTKHAKHIQPGQGLGMHHFFNKKCHFKVIEFVTIFR